MKELYSSGEVALALRVAMLLINDNDPLITQKEIGVLLNRAQPQVSLYMRKLKEEMGKDTNLRKRVERLKKELGMTHV